MARSKIKAKTRVLDNTTWKRDIERNTTKNMEDKRWLKKTPWIKSRWSALQRPYFKTKEEEEVRGGCKQIGRLARIDPSFWVSIN